MEETNYHRVTTSTSIKSVPSSLPAEAVQSQPTDEKVQEVVLDQGVSSLEQGGGIQSPSSKKTYGQKLALWQKSDLEQPNRLVGMMLRPLVFLTFPVIFYAGFSYGSNLVISRSYPILSTLELFS